MGIIQDIETAGQNRELLHTLTTIRLKAETIEQTLTGLYKLGVITEAERDAYNARLFAYLRKELPHVGNDEE